MPNPDRMVVLLVAPGFHTKPTRGSKLRSVGLWKKGAPKCGCASVKLIRLESRLWTSDGTVAISYRPPKLRLNPGLTRISSCKYIPNSVSRIPNVGTGTGSSAEKFRGRLVRRSGSEPNVKLPFELFTCRKLSCIRSRKAPNCTECDPFVKKTSSPN